MNRLDVAGMPNGPAAGRVKLGVSTAQKRGYVLLVDTEWQEWGNCSHISAWCHRCNRVAECNHTNACNRTSESRRTSGGNHTYACNRATDSTAPLSATILMHATVPVSAAIPVAATVPMHATVLVFARWKVVFFNVNLQDGTFDFRLPDAGYLSRHHRTTQRSLLR
jgi:hypothetical protein